MQLLPNFWNRNPCLKPRFSITFYYFFFLSWGTRAETATKTFYWHTHAEFYCYCCSCSVSEENEIRSYTLKQHRVSRLYCWASLPSPSDMANYSAGFKGICTAWSLNNNDKLKLCYLILYITTSFLMDSLVCKHSDYISDIWCGVWYFNFKLDNKFTWINPQIFLLSIHVSIISKDE